MSQSQLATLQAMGIFPGDQTGIKGRFFSEQESLAPVSIAAGSPEAVKVKGVEVIDIGRLVTFSLTGGPSSGLATAADQLVYIALKGQTSGLYYGVAFLASTASGAFIVAKAEKFDLVTQNQDTAAHTFSGYWQASGQGLAFQPSESVAFGPSAPAPAPAPIGGGGGGPRPS